MWGCQYATTHRSHAEKMASLRSSGRNVPDAIRAGEGGNFYMCPEYWCPISEVPMSREVENKMEYANPVKNH
jgi:hypothetical protein